MRSAELWSRWKRRDRIKGVVGVISLAIFFAPVVLGHYIDSDELSASQLRLLTAAWLILALVPPVVVHLVYRQIERREYEGFERSKAGQAARQHEDRG